MKIHTTQNLNSVGRIKSTDNSTIPNEEIRLDYIKHRMSLKNEPDTYGQNISFKEKALPRIAKKIIDTTSKRASDKQGVKEKILSSARFNNILNFIRESEVITNAGIAFAVGWLLRVPTILSLPEWLGGKHEEDKKMAAAHSGASVTMGLITATILTLPINKASKHAAENLYHKIKPELLAKRHPQLDLNSIKDASGKLVNSKFWKNKDGKAFDKNIKTPMIVARPKHLSQIAESTFKTMNIDIDMVANANKNVQDMVLRDGRKLVDVLQPKDMFIAIEEKGMGTTLKGLKDTNFFSLEFIDKDFLAKSMPELDINTAFVNGKITHPNQWKTKNGNSAFNFDIYLSNYLETAESTPVYTGLKRTEANGAQKYVAYQNNGNGGLGTAITNEMIDADKNVDTANKIVGWGIEILTRIPVGLCTVALINPVLDIFDFLKSNKPKETNAALAEQKSSNTDSSKEAAPQSTNNKNGEVSFKGKKPNKFINWLSEKYVLPVLNSDKIQHFVEKYDKKFSIPMTEALTIFGSLLMSSSYICGTMTNKKFKKDKNSRNTLAINQALGFIVPTALGVVVNKKIRPRVKQVTYDFVGNQTQRIKLMAQKGQITKKEEEKAIKAIAKASKGVPVLASLTVFTFIYRYFTPVAVTPLANKGGEWMNNYIAKKNAQKLALKQSQNSEKEIQTTK